MALPCGETEAEFEEEEEADISLDEVHIKGCFIRFRESVNVFQAQEVLGPVEAVQSMKKEFATQKRKNAELLHSLREVQK